MKMSRTIEVFENEEAERFLDYFSAYKKFSTKAEMIRRIIVSNVEATSRKSFPQTPELEISNQDLTAMGIDVTAVNGELDFRPARL
jgi:hypothetical protein